ncbi:MAG: HK97 family phage prohead protease [Pseudomonadota bacterium]
MPAQDVFKRARPFSPVTDRKFTPARIDVSEATGVFSGYASVFGVADLSGDVVLPGAFADSLAKRSASDVKLLFQHDPTEPIGVWTSLREDDHGLYAEGRLTTGVARAREVLSLMKAGALDGLSIGFATVTAETDPTTGHRLISAADLWEISIVTFPMLPEARVSAVKASVRPGRPTEREFERWLTREAGLSRSEARQVIAKGFRSLPAREASDPAAETKLISAIRRAASAMRT